MSDISPENIAATAVRIAPFIRTTPVIAAKVRGIAAAVTFKLEHLQHTGSFKARGAFSSLAGIQRPAGGVAAASGGNHGAAIAYAAREFGLPARIFVPANAPQSKVDRIVSYGAAIDQTGTTYQDAVDACLEYCAAFGARGFHAYDQVPVILGQGTLGREIERQCPDLDTLLVATGGGGLIGGIAAWYQRRVKIVSVEPIGCPTLHDALRAGQVTRIKPHSIAQDSLGASLAGSLMFPIARQYVQGAVLVSDDAIRGAMRWLWSEMQIVVEPGGATALAALLSGAYAAKSGEKVGVLLCGANIMPSRFAELVDQ